MDAIHSTFRLPLSNARNSHVGGSMEEMGAAGGKKCPASKKMGQSTKQTAGKKGSRAGSQDEDAGSCPNVNAKPVKNTKYNNNAGKENDDTLLKKCVLSSNAALEKSNISKI